MIENESLFWAKVNKRGGPLWNGTNCWVWMASVDKNGYGQFGNGETMVKAHRYSYQLVHGFIPFNVKLTSLCKNKTCVNTTHLAFKK